MVPTPTGAELREQVRTHYAEAARTATAAGRAAGADRAGGSTCCAASGAAVEVDERFGAARYDETSTSELPTTAVLASLGCGDPTAVADLRPGERVLDLGSGGGLDVLPSARRIGPTGRAHGVDMTAEMLDLARANAAAAGVTTVEFREGTIEALPFADASIDVVISDCVVDPSTDEPAVLAEAHRVLVPGGRVGISDVVADDDLTPAQRAERGSSVGCLAGALSRTEHLDGLVAAGFTGPSVELTHEVAPGLHGTTVRATRPAPPATGRTPREDGPR